MGNTQNQKSTENLLEKAIEITQEIGMPAEKTQKLLINDLYYEADDFGRFTEDEVKNAKLKYGKRLRYLKVCTPDGDSEFIIKKPSRATSSAVRDAIDKNDDDLAATIMISNCVVLGDTEDIDEDAVVFTKVTTFITSMVQEAELEAKKL